MLKAIETVYNGFRFRRLDVEVSCNSGYPAGEVGFSETAFGDVALLAAWAHVPDFVAALIVDAVDTGVGVVAVRADDGGGTLGGWCAAVMAGECGKGAEVALRQGECVATSAGTASVLLEQLIECRHPFRLAVQPALIPALSEKTAAATGMTGSEVAIADGAFVAAVAATQPHTVLALTASDTDVTQHGQTTESLAYAVNPRLAHSHLPYNAYDGIIPHRRCAYAAARQARFEFGETPLGPRS